MSNFLTSADIEDGKTEYDPKTKATSTYKLIDGGYEIHTKTPQANGTMKTEVRTFWDPKPCSEEDLIKEQENKKLVKKRMGKEIRIDQNTTMLTRAIEGGYEEVYTTTHEDGSKSSRTKTFFDSMPAEINEHTKTTVKKQDNKKNKLSKVSSVDSTDSVESHRRVVQQTQQQRNVSHNNNQETVEESRRFTQNIEVTENNRTVRKNSQQLEQNIKSITNTGSDGKKKKKTKSNIPPPPADFPQNETTQVVQRRTGDGGVEYLYNTTLETGRTVTVSKTVYEEEYIELTEEEVKDYKKTLKDAAKHTNLTTAKKLKSESGTKKVVPSENPGDVTTVETIKIPGGTEFHYTTVTAEGIIKKSVKTVYDARKTTYSDNETDEEEIVEEIEEEIIEPGEPITKTIETTHKLPRQFEEEVTITSHEKKEKKVKKSMMISS